MAKTLETLRLERAIRRATYKTGVFGCFEVTIGFFGKQWVDYMTYDTKGIFRCYEIKVSVSDFHSDAELSFVGNYNYFVMPRKLYEKVKDEIPDDIGVYVGDIVNSHGVMQLYLEKKPRKVDISGEVYRYRRSIGGRSTIVETPMPQVLKDSMIRSLYRDSDKLYLSGNDKVVGGMKTDLSKAEKKAEKAGRSLNRLVTVLANELGWKKTRKLVDKAKIKMSDL